MKLKPDRRQFTWGMTIFLTAAAILIFYFLIFHFSAVAGGLRKLNRSLSGILIGIMIAMILSPLMSAIENRWFRPYYHRKGVEPDGKHDLRAFLRMRKWSVFLTELVFLLILGFLAFLIVPSTIRSITDIVNNISSYIRNLTRAINQFLETKGVVTDANGKVIFESEELQQVVAGFGDEITEYINNTVIPNMDKVIQKVSDSVVQIGKTAVDLLVGIIVSIYILYSREKMAGQFKKLAYGLFRTDIANVIVGECRFIWKTFAGFFSGKIIDSLIIGVICMIGVTVMKLPYAGLLSVVVGVTNIIPYFGPWIGGIFGFALLILINPWQALSFLVFVICLQQFDGNILGPKILGSTTGLTSFWVIFAIMLFGAMFGMVGWVVGVPIFAVLYSWIRRFVNYSLQKKNMTTKASDYADIGAIRDGIMIPSAYVPVAGEQRNSGLFRRHGQHNTENGDKNSGDLSQDTQDTGSRDSRGGGQQ